MNKEERNKIDEKAWFQFLIDIIFLFVLLMANTIENATLRMIVTVIWWIAFIMYCKFSIKKFKLMYQIL